MMEKEPRKDPIAIFGAGGLGLDIGIELLACGDRVVFLDDRISVNNTVESIGSTLVGGSEKLENPPFLRRHELIIAIGNNVTRSKLYEKARLNAGHMPIFIHPDASAGMRIEIGDGVIIMRGALVANRVTIGRGVIINTGATIAHDTIIGDFANICDRATLGGECHIGVGAFIGLGATILTGIKVGSGAIVGSGANVIHDVPNGATVVGNPARAIDRKAVHEQFDSYRPSTLPEAKGCVVVPIGQGS